MQHSGIPITTAPARAKSNRPHNPVPIYHGTRPRIIKQVTQPSTNLPRHPAAHNQTGHTTQYQSTTAPARAKSNKPHNPHGSTNLPRHPLAQTSNRPHNPAVLLPIYHGARPRKSNRPHNPVPIYNATRPCKIKQATQPSTNLPRHPPAQHQTGHTAQYQSTTVTAPARAKPNRPHNPVTVPIYHGTRPCKLKQATQPVPN